MADVEFYGIGNTIFDNKSTEVVIGAFGTPTMTAEVVNYGQISGVSPTANVSPQVEFTTYMATSAIVRDIFVASAPLPFSTNPELVALIVNPTGSSSATVVNVVKCDRPQDSPDLTALPRTLVGQQVEFIGATGGATPLTGSKRTITAYTVNTITLNTTLGTAPTLTDRISIDISRSSRETPFLEFILK